MTLPRTPVTAEELVDPRYSEIRCELIDGEVIELARLGEIHGVVALEIGSLIANHVKAHKLGRVHGSEAGFTLRRNPDTVRAPDVAFTSSAKLRGKPGRGFSDIAPDLVVEVISPRDTAPYLQCKVETWLDSGVRLVWVVYPDTESVAVYRSFGDAAVLRGDDRLDGGSVLPGFSVPVKEIRRRVAL